MSLSHYFQLCELFRMRRVPQGFILGPVLIRLTRNDDISYVKHVAFVSQLP